MSIPTEPEKVPRPAPPDALHHSQVQQLFFLWPVEKFKVRAGMKPTRTYSVPGEMRLSIAVRCPDDTHFHVH